MERINVTKVFLPPLEEYEVYLKQIWSNDQVTNQGPLLREFEEKVKGRLRINNFHFTTNGTVALQVALKALDITAGEIITTPFSYVASTSAIIWERCEPIFVDIEPDTFCIDVNKIEAAITEKTRAIMAVHVFGNPCDIEKIEQISKKYKLKIIYDAAHAFGAEYNNKSLLDYGDISICSFHGTKLFHTIEGGAIIASDNEVSNKIELIKRFGHNADDHYRLGINAKASEFQAAMGLCNLKYIDEIIEKRKKVSELYNQLLSDRVTKPTAVSNFKYNYAYYPVLLQSEDKLLRTINALNQKNIFPRRYFYPSLNTLPYLQNSQRCPVSEDISRRIICLPLYPDLEEMTIKLIVTIINENAS